MGARGRPGLSAREKRELWSRWRRGQSLSEIGRALGKHAGSIYGVLAASGGITPVTRKRSKAVLSLQEREEISRCMAKGLSIRAIAKRLGKAPSTISREIARNGGRRRYRAARADQRAWARAKRPKTPLLVLRPALKTIVAAKLQDDWSPEQIAGWFAAHYPRGKEMRVSHETIYRSLYLQTRGLLHRELLQRLRTGRLHAQRQEVEHGRAASRPNHRRRFHPRSTDGDFESSEAWALGRRPPHRGEATPTSRPSSSGTPDMSFS